ncbi:unnamed protein product [Blepharisma stoltei]|uniref:Uncharacterized protein n=1 Tax=Blepharisma stoltei TaxID=1481888 RepID=A0AAU9JQC5_9CILI|nr:unnamed protein product [Blepharisma stoltei]
MNFTEKYHPSLLVSRRLKRRNHDMKLYEIFDEHKKFVLNKEKLLLFSPKRTKHRNARETEQASADLSQEYPYKKSSPEVCKPLKIPVHDLIRESGMKRNCGLNENSIYKITTAKIWKKNPLQIMTDYKLITRLKKFKRTFTPSHSKNPTIRSLSPFQATVPKTPEGWKFTPL